MAPSTTPEERLQLALGVLAAEPTSLEALRDDGGAVPIDLVGHDREMLHAMLPREAATPGLGLRLRLRTDRGSGYDLGLSVAHVFFHSERLATAQLAVERVRRVNGRRSGPRARVRDQALVGVLYSSGTPGHSEFDVHVVDLSPDGIAFVTDADLRVGDLLSVMTTVDRKLVRMRVRALHVTTAHYGRRRVGCEVTSVGGTERARLAMLAALHDAGGDERDRGAATAA